MILFFMYNVCMHIISVYITNASLSVDKPFSYAFHHPIEKYKRVIVPFNHKNSIGIVVDCRNSELDYQQYEEKYGYGILDVYEVIDEEPIFDEKMFDLAKWLSATTISPLVSCINAMLPKALKTTKSIKPAVKEEYLYLLPFTSFKTKKQEEYYHSLKDGMKCSLARKRSISIFNSLYQQGAFRIAEEEKRYEAQSADIKPFLDLNPDQRAAFEQFINTDKLVSLLYGVTGSGKTEVYLHLAREYLKKNREVLILVPEISLTPQMIKRVKERFSDVIFYHSELSDQEKYEQFMRVKRREAYIVVGTRSSIFLPFNDLGLIIIDEEHDNSYKQENVPCYNVRNVAIKRANDNNGKVLLASATPSLDSYTRAKKSDYCFLSLPKRINDAPPLISTVDLNSEIRRGGSYIISKPLQDEIRTVLENGKQAIIVLNRRGYSPVVKCKSCGSTLMCGDCDVALNYHNDTKSLVCHQCGKIYPLTRKCPNCNSNEFLYYGFGTMKATEELQRLFPNARIDRMDRDNTSRKGSHQKILERLEKHETDILIGTQMIAKGLDYPDVTLVGILNADSGLMRQDYNTAKMTFDLLMQASGRSGRANDKGKVIIQTFNEDHYVIKAVLRQDYEYFYNIEMNYRYKTSYPPYAHLLSIIMEDVNDEKVQKLAKSLYESFKSNEIKCYKPTKIAKMNKLQRYRLIIAGKSLIDLINKTNPIIRKSLASNNGIRIKVDIDPLYLE